jgi:hypothetical protein
METFQLMILNFFIALPFYLSVGHFWPPENGVGVPQPNILEQIYPPTHLRVVHRTQHPNGLVNQISVQLDIAPNTKIGAKNFS